jgi:hypothetical protein
MGFLRSATLWGTVVVLVTITVAEAPGIIGQPWENQGRQFAGVVLILVGMMALGFVIWLLEYGLQVNRAPISVEVITWVGLVTSFVLWLPFLSLLPLVTGWTVFIERSTKYLRPRAFAAAAWGIGAGAIAWMWSQNLVK